MHYELTKALSKRKCHFCSNLIEKKTMHFRQIFYRPRADFPTVKNICLSCIQKFYDEDWIKFLNDLLNRSEELKSMVTPIIKKEFDKTKKFICDRCQKPNVSWHSILEYYVCSACDEGYEDYDMERLKEVTE